MKFSASKRITWTVALVVGLLGILATFVTIPVLSGFAFWLVVVAFIILLLATALGGF